MLLRDAMDLLGCEMVSGPAAANGRPVETVFAADLMSDVLAFSEPGALLVTGLSSVQSAHAADVADLAAIVFVAGKRPPAAVLELAGAKGIPLFTTRLSLFETCGILYRAGLRPAHRS
jgi:hypothetical protein